MSAVNPIEHLIILTDREREFLVRAIESAIHVRKRHQFFLWAQGQFRGVLPHEILVCLRLGDHGQVLQLECFHGTVLDGANYDRLCSPVNGFAVLLARKCCESGTLVLSAAGAENHGELTAGLLGNGLRNALACCTERLQGSHSVYLLFDLDQEPNRRHAYFLELLMPHLQMATMRLAESRLPDPNAPMAGGARLVTDREVEILRLVQQGKSNHEIGAALGISPLTVKNHVQKIYRKLNVQNRAHAVSRGISLRLLDFAVG
jgi:transcriptional regulator EpsA